MVFPEVPTKKLCFPIAFFIEMCRANIIVFKQWFLLAAPQ